MIRHSRTISSAVVVIAAFAALTASAQASTFTAPGAGAGVTTRLKPAKDGTGKTSHHVFVVGNAAGTSTVSFTCEEVTGQHDHNHLFGPDGHATMTSTYITCNAAGQSVTVTNTGCIVTFTANGEVHLLNDTAKVCSHGAGNSPIDVEFTGCKVEVGAQTLKGVKYHNLNAAGTTVGSGEGTKVTVEPVVTGITYNAAGANCNFGTTSNGTYTTGNTIVTGERGGAAVELRWDS